MRTDLMIVLNVSQIIIYINLVYSGEVVSQTEPQEKLGLFWGYNVRVAQKFEDIFDDCPFEEGGYDLKIGIGDNGEPADFVDFS